MPESHQAAAHLLSGLRAPATWTCVDFLSDLHLHADDPGTFALWRRYLAETTADAIFVLGDLFEVWVGDDLLEPQEDDAQHPERAFLRGCADVLRTAAQRRSVFFIHGNRDFLLGEAFFNKTGVTALSDPCPFEFGASTWLLSHGDAQCLADTDYQAFRHQVRAAPWQTAFLAQALPERESIARRLRDQSEARKRGVGVYCDLDPDTILQQLRAHGARTLIHGHTHRPADHSVAEGLNRWVLSDWDANAAAPRAEVLRLYATGEHQRIAPL